MKIIVAILTLISSIYAQGIVSVMDFDAEGYIIKKVGYPSNIVPLHKKGYFAYAEYWLKGKAGRFYTAYYLQGMAPNGAELWAKPIYDKGKPVIKPIKLVKLQNNIVVVGKYLDKKLEHQWVYKVFSQEGGNPIGLTKNIGVSQVKMSDKYFQDFRENHTKTHIIWYAFQKELKRNDFPINISVINAQGRKLWERSLKIKVSSKLYQLYDINTDSKGNALMLFTRKSYEDSLSKPLVVFYDYRQKNFIYDTLETHINNGKFLVLKNNIYLTGITYDKDGFTNSSVEKWKHFFWTKYDILKRYSRDSLRKEDLPDNWNNEENSYKDFSLVFDKDNQLLYWLAEEYDKKIKPQGVVNIRRNVAIACIDIPADTLRWFSHVEKNQRDFSDKLISFYAAPSEMFLNLLYLTEPGAEGKLRLLSINNETGGQVYKDLTDNLNSDFYIFPKKSAKISGKVIATIGKGDLKKNGYRIILIALK